jgi:PncC family amidohydrolase
MEEVVGRRLAMTGFTLAVAESCTGGLIAQRLTSVPGSSKYFTEGVVTYSNESKVRLLGVDKKMILEFGAVSQQVARDMARGVRHRAKTDFGLAVTGIAGPDGGTEEKPVGLVFIALADDAHTEHRRLMIPGDRELVRWRASQAALGYVATAFDLSGIFNSFARRLVLSMRMSSDKLDPCLQLRRLHLQSCLRAF